MTNACLRLRALTTTLAVCGLSTLGANALAQAAWPTKQVRVVVGFAPGGSTDVMARIVSQSLTESLGQPVIVENRPGASGNIAVSEVARAAPDGSTFLIAPTSVETANPYLFKSNVLPSRDLTPVASISKTQMYLVVKPQSSAKDARELVAQAKAHPGQMSYTSAGAGTPPHLACELFKKASGTFITHIPYRGAAPALQDVLSGQADFVCDPGIAFPHIRANKVKLLGIVSSKRSPFFPDVPTLAEQGIPGADLDIWFGMWAPKGTPPEVIARMSKDLGKALAAPALKTRFADLGGEPVYMDSVEFKGLLAKEDKVLSTLIKEQKINVD